MLDIYMKYHCISKENKVRTPGGSMGLFNVRIGWEQKKAYIAVDLKLVDTDTVEIIDTRTLEATSSSEGMGLGVSIWDFSGDLSG
jgi:curli biogenesis system outer membrane secretion channel CsgG